MNKLLILTFCFLFQNQNVKEFTLKTSKNESIIVQVDLNKSIAISKSEIESFMRGANAIELIDLKILNKTNNNLTFSIFKNNCFYGEKYILENTDGAFFGIVCGGKFKKNIIKPKGFISSRIPALRWLHHRSSVQQVLLAKTHKSSSFYF